MATTFDKQVGDFVASVPGRLNAVFRQSSQDVIEEAQTDYNSGGNIPRDTGFLISTGDAALNRLPVGETTPPEGQEVFRWDADAALAVIAQATVEDSIFFGWSAEYAQYMENRFGFMRLAIQNWPDIVRRNAQRLERSARR